MKLTPKQIWALNLLTDQATKWLGYGGAAGGGKSILGCFWLNLMCETLPNSKWFIGRDSLKDTRGSVLFSFKKMSEMLGFKNYKYTHDDRIVYKNGSEIEFLDLSFYPIKDPFYERFGSKEYTGGWMEEAGSVHPLAFEVLKTRVGRWYNAEFNIPGKILITFNPKKNWVDTTFYRPYKNEEETPETKFIPALATDNPHLTEEYMENLRNIKDKATRERLLHGNFEYDEDPTALLNYQDISNIWQNSHISMNHYDKYIIADIARFGSDKAIVTVWYGWVLLEYYIFDVSSTVMIQNCINAMRAKHQISANRCLGDEDGVGGGVIDNCGIIGFKNGGKPSNPAYQNLKTECAYKLAEIVQQIYFQAEVSEEIKQRVEQELSQLKTYDADKDGKLRILPKEKIKENIGRSPDWLDVFIMRCFFVLFNPGQMNQALQDALRYVG